MFTGKQACQAQPRALHRAELCLRLSAGAAIIVLAVFFAYSSSITGGFILDDDRLVYDNDLIKAPDGLSQFWCTAKSDDFWPVTSSGFWFEWRLWDMCPAGYHVTNLILHAAEALLIWVILRRLSIPGVFWRPSSLPCTR